MRGFWDMTTAVSTVNTPLSLPLGRYYPRESNSNSLRRIIEASSPVTCFRYFYWLVVPDEFRSVFVLFASAFPLLDGPDYGAVVKFDERKRLDAHVGRLELPPCHLVSLRRDNIPTWIHLRYKNDLQCQEAAFSRKNLVSFFNTYPEKINLKDPTISSQVSGTRRLGNFFLSLFFRL